MIDFKLNGKKIEIASSWDDLTHAQFCETFNLDSDFLKVVSLASGLDYETIKNSKIEGNIDGLIQALKFFNTSPAWDKPVTKCGKYDLPINKDGQYNIQYESLGQ